jgi:hypothetical protein
MEIDAEQLTVLEFIYLLSNNNGFYDGDRKVVVIHERRESFGYKP